MLALLETLCNNHVQKVELTSLFRTFLHLLPPKPTLVKAAAFFPKFLHALAQALLFSFFPPPPFRAKDCFTQTPNILWSMTKRAGGGGSAGGCSKIANT